MRRIILPIFTFALSFVLLQGCNTQAAGNFNNTLADLQEKLSKAEKKMEDTLEWPPSDEKKKANTEEFAATVADARKQFDAVKVPDNQYAVKFHAGFNDYLKAQEEAVPLYKQWLASEGKPGKDDGDKLRDAFDKMRAKRKSALMLLPGLQKAYTNDVGITLKK